MKFRPSHVTILVIALLVVNITVGFYTGCGYGYGNWGGVCGGGSYDDVSSTAATAALPDILQGGDEQDTAGMTCECCFSGHHHHSCAAILGEKVDYSIVAGKVHRLPGDENYFLQLIYPPSRPPIS